MMPTGTSLRILVSLACMLLGAISRVHAQTAPTCTARVCPSGPLPLNTVASGPTPFGRFECIYYYDSASDGSVQSLFCDYNPSDGQYLGQGASDGNPPVGCDSFGSTAVCIAQSCPVGTIIFNDLCYSCPTGNASPGGTTTVCTPCLSQANEHVNDDQSACVCNAGFGQQQSDTCQPCAAGTVNNGQADNCVSCATGFMPNAQQTECVLAASGTSRLRARARMAKRRPSKATWQ